MGYPETCNDSVGELVKKDQKLASSYLGETLAVASGFLAATAGVAGAVNKQGVSSIQGYSDRLRNLGVSDAQIRQMAETHQLPETVEVISPVDGFILARNIYVRPTFRPLYGVLPYRRFEHSLDRGGDLWQRSARLPSRDNSACHSARSDQGKTFSARVSNTLPQVDPVTRTLKLRLEADNPGFALRPDMFVNVELPVRVPPGLTVPLDALIDSGCEQRVFVERSKGMFERRQVETGRRLSDRVAILRGLVEGERVVAAGTFLVDSERRLRSSVQAPPKQQQFEKVTPQPGSRSGLAVHAAR